MWSKRSAKRKRIPLSSSSANTWRRSVSRRGRSRFGSIPTKIAYVSASERTRGNSSRRLHPKTSDWLRRLCKRPCGSLWRHFPTHDYLSYGRRRQPFHGHVRNSSNASWVSLRIASRISRRLGKTWKSAITDRTNSSTARRTHDWLG